MTRAAPFAFIAPAFAAGIWLASQFVLPPWLSALVAVLAVGIAIAARHHYEETWAAVLVALLAFGSLHYTLGQPTIIPGTAAYYSGSTVALEGIVCEEPDVRPEFTYLRVQAQRLLIGLDILPLIKPQDRCMSGLEQRLFIELGVIPSSNIVQVRADRSIDWHYGDVAYVYGDLTDVPFFGDFDYQAYLANQGVHAWISRPERLQRIGEGQGDWFYAALLRYKAALRLSIQRIMPAPESALLTGILIGDDKELPANIVTAFGCTGTAHIVAISGFNVSVVISLVVLLLIRLMSRRSAAAVAIPAIWIYMLLAGMPFSVVRAGVMAILSMVGLLFWRRGFTLNTLCAAVFFILLVDPAGLFDIGFQLSVAATLGLVLYIERAADLVQQRIEHRVGRIAARRWVVALTDIFLVTLIAYLITFPLVVIYFNQLSLVSPLTNALVLPLQSAAMVTGMVAATVGLFAQSLGMLVALPSYALLTATLRVVEWTGQSPGVCPPVYGVGTPAALAYYGVLFGVTAVVTQPASVRQTLLRWLKKNLRTGTVLVVLIILAVIAAVLVYQRPDGKLHVTFTGKSALIVTPSGKQVVFGGDVRVLAALGRAVPLWDRNVELLILPQRNDLVRGDSLPILQRYRVGMLIQPDGVDDPSAMLDAWQAQAAVQGTQALTVPFGTQAIVEPGMWITFEQRLKGAIGARLSYGSTTIELAGDAGVISGTVGGADVLFVDPDGAPPGLLNAAQPGYVVWADAGGIPRRLDDGIRAIALRDVNTVEFVSDGKTLSAR